MFLHFSLPGSGWCEASCLWLMTGGSVHYHIYQMALPNYILTRKIYIFLYFLLTWIRLYSAFTKISIRQEGKLDDKNVFWAWGAPKAVLKPWFYHSMSVSEQMKEGWCEAGRCGYKQWGELWVSQETHANNEQIHTSLMDDSVSDKHTHHLLHLESQKIEQTHPQHSRGGY